MPDENNDTAGGSGDNGEYTGADLAAALPIADELRNLADGEEITQDEFVKILMQRLGFKHESGVDDKYANPGMKAIAEVIYGAMEQRMRTNAIASNIDLRPYLDVLKGKKLLQRDEIVDGPNSTKEVTDYKEVDTGGYVDHLNEELTKTLTTQFEGSNLGDADRKKILDDAVRYKPDMVGIELSQADLTHAAGQGPAEDELTLTSPSAQVNGGQMVVDQLEQAFRSDFYTLDQMVNLEADNAADLPLGYYPVRTEIGKTPTRTRTTGPTEIDAPVKTMSIAQTVALLYDKTPEEVTALQQNMAAAGYFDRLGVTTYGIGDQTDKATNDAWKLLVTDSIKKRVAIPTLLGQGARDYRDKVRTERMGAMSKLDPSYTRVLADDWAQSAIGRRLTPDEQAAIHLQLELLVGQRAGYVAGATDNTADRAPVGEMGVDQNDITLALEDKYGVEERQTAFAEGWSRLVNSGQSYKAGNA